jgi:hypothetical protein
MHLEGTAHAPATRGWRALVPLQASRRVSLLAPEQPAHEDRGQYGRGGCGRAFKDRLQDVVFDPALIGYVYEPLRHLMAYDVGYPGRRQGYHPLLRRVVHASPLSAGTSLDQYPRTAPQKHAGKRYAGTTRFTDLSADI